MKREHKPFHKFMILWAGELISAIGTGISAFGLGVYVFEQTGKASAVSLIMLMAFLPTILLSAPAGVLADRFDRRKMMILGDSLSALGLLFILFCMRGNGATVLQVSAGVCISAIFAALLEPAYRATVTDLLSEEEFAKASGLMQIASSAKYLVSPVIGGFLLSVTEISTLLWLDIATIVITVSTTLFIKKSIPVMSVKNKDTFLQMFLEGGRTVWQNKGVRQLVLIMTLVTFSMGFIQTLLTPLILSFTDSKTLGLIETISATGVMASSILIGIFSLIKNYPRALANGLFFAGIAIGMIGIWKNVVVMGAIGFLFFAMLPFVNTSADYMVRTNIENEVQGRAWGIISIVSQMGFVISYAISGFLADCVFEPALMSDGMFGDTIGAVLGVGPGRGIACMLILAGILMIIVAGVTASSVEIKKLHNLNKEDNLQNSQILQNYNNLEKGEKEQDELIYNGL